MPRHYKLLIFIYLILLENVLTFSPLFLSAVELYYSKEAISKISITTNNTQHTKNVSFVNYINSSSLNKSNIKLNVSTNSTFKFTLPSNCIEFGRKNIRISFVNGIYHSEDDWRNITKDLESTFGLEVRPFYNPSSGAIISIYINSYSYIYILKNRELDTRCNEGRLRLSGETKRRRDSLQSSAAFAGNPV